MINFIKNLFKKKTVKVADYCPKCNAGCYNYYTFKLIPDVETRDWGRIVPDRFNISHDLSAWKEVDGITYTFPAEEHHLKICLNCFYIPNIPYWFAQLLYQSRYYDGIHGKIFKKYKSFYFKEMTDEEGKFGFEVGTLPYINKLKEEMYKDTPHED